MTTACKSKQPPANHPTEESSSITFSVGANVVHQLRELARGRELTEHDIAREVVIASLAGPSTTDLLAYLRSREEAVQSQSHLCYEQLKEIRQGLFCAFSYFLSSAGNLSIDEAIKWAQANMFPKSGTEHVASVAPLTPPSPPAVRLAGPNPLGEFIDPIVPPPSAEQSAANEQEPCELPSADQQELTRGETPDVVELVLQAMRTAFELGTPFEEVLARARAKFDTSLN